MYPTIYQSIHVFEHSHQAGCCNHCLQDEPISKEEFAVFDSYSAKQDECPLCNFHYAKLHVTHGEEPYFEKARFSQQLAAHHPKPFVLFQGFTFGLRAPPFSSSTTR